MQGQADPPLSPLGREQASALDLSGCDAVLSSDLRRAVETARLAGREPLQDIRLREQSWGAIEGMTLSEALQHVSFNWYTDVDGKVADGESMRDVWERLSTIDLASHGDDVAVVTHGDTIRVALCAFTGRPVEEVEPHVPPNCSVTVLEI